MRVSVIINSKAGSVNPALIKAKIEEALFRCDLHYCSPQTIPEMQNFLNNECEKNTDFLIVCGGDGTVNLVLQEMMKNPESHVPLCLIRSGTANDLAHEIGISNKIDQAARNIFEGKVKKIDVIKVIGDGESAYMLTNGGLGLPTLAADLANLFRQKMHTLSITAENHQALQYLARQAYKMTRKVGSQIYSLMTVEAIRRWENQDWNLQIEMDSAPTLTTQAPIVLVSNQPKIGRHFQPAPYTSNSDGTVNLLLAETTSPLQHLQAALNIRKGDLSKGFRSFELKKFKIKSLQRPLTFFGDGEILHRNVQELEVHCLPQALKVVAECKTEEMI